MNHLACRDLRCLFPSLLLNLCRGRATHLLTSWENRWRKCKFILTHSHVASIFYLLYLIFCLAFKDRCISLTGYHHVPQFSQCSQTINTITQNRISQFSTFVTHLYPLLPNDVSSYTTIPLGLSMHAIMTKYDISCFYLLEWVLFESTRVQVIRQTRVATYTASVFPNLSSMLGVQKRK